MNISITGNLGSGKSTICNILKEKGFDIVSAGSIFRGIAIEIGISVEELNKKINTDIKNGNHDVDDMIDERMAAIGKNSDNHIFDSRMAWHFVPDSFKVFLHVDIKEAAKRIYHDQDRKESEHYSSESECLEALRNRQNMELERFIELYQENYYDMDNYDLVVDITDLTPTQAVEIILKNMEKRA